MAPLEAMYGTKLDQRPVRVSDVRLTILPYRLAFMCFAQTRERTNTADEFTRTWSSYSWMLNSSCGLKMTSAALLTRTSMPPTSSARAAASLSSPARSFRSHGKYRTPSTIPSSTFWGFGASGRSSAITFAPSSAYRATRACPIVPRAPVTRTFLPLSSGTLTTILSVLLQPAGNSPHRADTDGGLP